MPDLPPYLEAKDFIRARALVVRGQQYDVVVLGTRVYLTWRTDMGKNLGWVPAADVERACTRCATHRMCKAALKWDRSD